MSKRTRQAVYLPPFSFDLLVPPTFLFLLIAERALDVL